MNAAILRPMKGAPARDRMGAGAWVRAAGVTAILAALLAPPAAMGDASKPVREGEVSRDRRDAGIRPGGFDRYVEALSAEKTVERQDAARNLGRMGDPRAVDPLLKALGDPFEDVRNAAADSLERLGEPLGPLIRDTLAGSVPARKALILRNDPRALWPIMESLRAYRREVRISAARALMDIGDPRAAGPLIRAMGDEYPPVREMAAWALGRLDDPRILPAMLRALGDSTDPVRSAAAYALGRSKSPEAVAPLIRALWDRHSGVREGAAWSLGRLGDPRAVGPLIQGLHDSHEKVREAAAYSLGNLGDARAADPLARLLDDPKPKVRLAAVWSRGRFRDRKAAGILLRAVGDGDPEVRDAGAEVLRGMGEPLGEKILQALAGSREAADELASGGDPRIAVPLIQALGRPEADVRRRAAAVLGRTRDPRAAGPLIRMAGGWNLRDRVAAASALFGFGPAAGPRWSIVLRVLTQRASLAYLLGIVLLAVVFAGGIRLSGKARSVRGPDAAGGRKGP